MTIRLLSAALVAGFLAAVVATGLQFALTSPLILKAEVYEEQAGKQASLASPFAGLIVPAHGGEQHEHGTAEEWQPAPGFERMAYTGLATLVGGVGYALLLGAAMLALQRQPSPETGLAFGIAGFFCVALAPAMGLPPELPGMGSAPLGIRQAWWVMTALATAMGIYLIVIRRIALTIAGGIVLIVAPHVVGAPFVVEESRLPAALAAQFAARSLGISLVFWAVIGLAYGWAWHLFGERNAAGRSHA
jgi:cobalt transporter subunit CbtA